MTNDKKGEPEPMSAEKRRNALVVFGGVAVVLAVALVFIAPNFPYRSEDASGAIGAVEKHRAPQIKSSDVVLGDEQTKKEQQILYADFLKDAAALQSISNELSNEAMSVEARTQIGIKALEQRQADIQARYALEAKNALDAMNRLGAQQALGKAAMENLDSLVANRNAFSAKLLEMAKALEAHACCNNKVLAYAKSLENAESLEAVANADSLVAAFNVDALAAMVQNEAAYIEAMVAESKSLEAAAENLQAKNLDAFNRDVLSAASALEAKALENMDAALANEAEAMEALGRMDQLVGAAKNSQQLSNFDAALEAQAADLRSEAAVAMQAQLVGVRNHLEARKTVGLRDNTLGRFADHLQKMSQLAGQKSVLASALPDAQDFVAQARALEQRANDLQARSR